MSYTQATEATNFDDEPPLLEGELYCSLLARLANLPEGLYVLLALISFLMIVRRPIISEFSGPIFTIFSPNDRYLFVDDRSGPLFPIP